MPVQQIAHDAAFMTGQVGPSQPDATFMNGQVGPSQPSQARVFSLQPESGGALLSPFIATSYLSNSDYRNRFSYSFASIFPVKSSQTTAMKGKY